MDGFQSVSIHSPILCGLWSSQNVEISCHLIAWLSVPLYCSRMILWPLNHASNEFPSQHVNSIILTSHWLSIFLRKVFNKKSEQQLNQSLPEFLLYAFLCWSQNSLLHFQANLRRIYLDQSDTSVLHSIIQFKYHLNGTKSSVLLLT